MSKQKVRTDYDRSAYCYEKRYRALQWEKYEIMLTTPLQGKILDLGCGTGLLAKFLDNTLTGVDISYNMLQYAVTKESVIQADMDFLPFRSSVFDAVLSFTALQNLPSVDYVFREVERVLKEGHPFIFTVLRKEFHLSTIEKAEHYFCIKEKRICGEDVGFICL